MGERTRAFDWSKTPVGLISAWPQCLRTMVRTMLESRYAMWLGWGPGLTFFYNDAYARMTLGRKHPWALGRPAREVWSEIWDDIGPRAEAVLRTGKATWDEQLLLILERRGFPEESYHTFSYSPIPADDGSIGGLLCVVTEETERMIGERRLRTLRELAARTTEEARSAEDACQTAAKTLADNPHDLPFVLIYLLDDDVRTARLVGATGLPARSPAAAPLVELAAASEQGRHWPLETVVQSGRAHDVTDLAERFGSLPGRPWPEPPRQAVILPLARPGQARLAGFVVAAVSPRLVLDDAYRGFLDLLAGHVATAVANARAYEEEHRRAEALAELDRAKTAFFSTVSHEFRTPLTLMLGPVEELLSHSHTGLAPAAAAQLEVVQRNGLRLLRLVNTLLDFSRIEAGRVRAVYQPTDLGALTAELASVFRAAVERADLQLRVDCPRLPEPVFVDREMWEKIVLNLISNAFKFTFDGEIAVSLSQDGRSAVLRIRDTGTGIPPEEMPHLFERFHRVQNARGRTHEGSGIGLALVQELVKLHGGRVTAESRAGQGTTFTVALPLGSAHLPAPQIVADRAARSTASVASPFVEEALHWLPDTGDASAAELARHDEPLPVAAPLALSEAGDRRPSILIADDNADMRQYLSRLLAERYRVRAVADGEAALTAVREGLPDLVLTDVMMPRLDGFGLLQALRGQPETRHLPVIMLSARAGEESRVEGMEAGADDYLVKPFSARELLARVSGHLQMAQLRRESDRALRQLTDELAQANRRKDEFLATLAHELRNPLAPLRNGLQIIKLARDTGPAVPTARAMMERQLEQLVRLVDDLLDVSRITRGKVELRKDPVQLGAVLGSAVETSRPLIEQRGHRLTVELPQSPVVLSADFTRLAQVFLNLLNNAAKYTEPNGHIWLTAQRHGESVVVSVRDTGIGIPADKLTSIFDMFSQVDGSLDKTQGGLGIGLTLVKQLVEMHGGSVEARSDGPGHGADFLVRLPILVDSSAQSSPPQHAPESAKSKPGDHG